MIQPDDKQHGDAAADEDGVETMELLRRLNAGELTHTHLTFEQRVDCVAHLTEEGFSTADIAAVMKMGERMVRRDREAARRASALRPTLRLGDELLGEYQRLAHTSIERLSRISRDPKASDYARLWAEEAVTRVYDRFVARAGKLGYLEPGERRLNEERGYDPATGESTMPIDKETLLQILGEMGGKGLDEAG